MPNRKTQGLRLTLGGAPLAPMMLSGIPGIYRSDRPAPVGGPGELSLDAAKALSEDSKVPLELVDIADKDVDEFRAAARQDFMEARGGLTDTTRGRRLAERELDRVKDQAAALSLPKEV